MWKRYEATINGEEFSSFLDGKEVLLNQATTPQLVEFVNALCELEEYATIGMVLTLDTVEKFAATFREFHSFNPTLGEFQSLQNAVDTLMLQVERWEKTQAAFEIEVEVGFDAARKSGVEASIQTKHELKQMAIKVDGYRDEIEHTAFDILLPAAEAVWNLELSMCQ